MSAMSNSEKKENPRKGRGRQKVNMAKMENESNLQVTFSKRRNGVFKKASELSSRCGAETALVVFSPGGKAYSFGHPSVEMVATRFLAGQNGYKSPDQLMLFEAERQMAANATPELNQLEDQVEIEKKQGKELEHMFKHMSRRVTQMEKFECQHHDLDQVKGSVLDYQRELRSNAEKDKSFTSYFLGPTGPSLDLSLQGHTCHFSHYNYANVVGNNGPYGSHPPYAGNSTFVAPDYVPILNVNSGFVIPYTPFMTVPSTHDVFSDAGGELCKDDEE